MKKTIATIAKECMVEADTETIDLGVFGILDEIYDRCAKQNVIKKPKRHPLDRQVYIMAQLRKSKHFKLTGYINYNGFGRAYSKCTVLKLI